MMRVCFTSLFLACRALRIRERSDSSHWSPRPSILRQVPVSNDWLSSDQQMPYTGRQLRRRLVGRSIVKLVRVEHDDVGICSSRQRPLAQYAASGGCDHAGWEQARASDELEDAHL